jgi:hypothetical protein
VDVAEIGVRRTRSLLPSMRFGRKGTAPDRERPVVVTASGVHAAAGEQTDKAVGCDRVSPEANARLSGTGDKTSEESRILYGKMISQALPFLWPDGWALRCRMVLCALALIFSRLCNMMIPLCYKGAIDALSNAPPLRPQPGSAPTSPVTAASLDFWNRFFPPSESTAQHAGDTEPTQAMRETWKTVVGYVAAYVCLKGYVGVQADVRNLIFTPVSQFTRKRSQLCVLNHLHALSNSYHAGRKTGAVLHVVERGE